MGDYLKNADATCRYADAYVGFSSGIEYTLVTAALRATAITLTLGFALKWFAVPQKLVKFEETLQKWAKGPLFEASSLSNWAIAGGVVGTLGTGIVHHIVRRTIRVHNGHVHRQTSERNKVFVEWNSVGKERTFFGRVGAVAKGVVVGGFIVAAVHALSLGAHIGLLRYTGKLDHLSKAYGFLTGAALAHVVINTLAVTSGYYHAKTNEQAPLVDNPQPKAA